MLGLSPAVVIGLDRLITSLVEHHFWLKGVVIALIASLCCSVGFCLQNLSQKSNLVLPIQKQVAALYQPWNIAGIVLVLISSLLECVALAYANESLLASIAVTSLAFNAILSPILVGEKATYLDWIVVGQIMSGVLITVFAGPHSFQLLSLHQIGLLFHTSELHFFLIVLSLWAFSLLYLTMLFDPADASIGRLSSLSRSKRYELHRLCLSALAGTLDGLSMMAIRGAVSLVVVSLDGANQLRFFGSWVFILSTMTLVVANIAIMNHALKLYENLYVIPTKSVFEVIVGVSGGMFFYEESVSLTYLQMALFFLGLSICVSGLVVMLTTSDAIYLSETRS